MSQEQPPQVPQVIYEMVDATNDEMYFTFGLFLDLDKAKKIITECDKTQAMTNSGDDNDFETIEIRVRNIDELIESTGKVVATFERSLERSESFSDCIWHCKETTPAPAPNQKENTSNETN